MNLIRRMYAWGYSTISRIFVLHSPAITLDFFYKKYIQILKKNLAKIHI
jgi:hypothetical protein